MTRINQPPTATPATSSPTSNGEKVEFVRVEISHQGQRLDNFLLRHLKGVPRSRIYRLVRRGEVRVNKKRCKPEQKLISGDIVRIPPYSGASTPSSEKPSHGLQALLRNCVLYEDEQLLVLNKPAGLAVHGGTGIRIGVIEALRQMKPEWSSVELAHRIDRDTSGCLVVSKNTIFLRHIQAELKARTVDKYYMALVHGEWPEGLTLIDAPLQKNELSSGERIVKVMPMGKPSLTGFKIAEKLDQSTLLEVKPETGRTHQIRVHCQHGGHAIVGDPKYTSNSSSERLSKVKNLCLHAWKIGFSLPNSANRIEVEAPMDKYMSALIADLR